MRGTDASLYIPQIAALAWGDFVNVDCAACHHIALQAHHEMPICLRERPPVAPARFIGRAYGKHHVGMVEEQNIRKIRLWCSAKGDHAGAPAI
jgi:hypothetical protein